MSSDSQADYIVRLSSSKPNTFSMIKESTNAAEPSLDGQVREVAARYATSVPTKVIDLGATTTDEGRLFPGPGYKQTEIGLIPEDWHTRRLADLAEIRSGVTKNSARTPRDAISVNYLRVANVQDGFLDLSDISTIAIPRCDLSRFSVLPGDVLMNEGGDLDKLGRGALWRGELEPCVHQNHVFVVRSGPALDPEFLNIWSAGTLARRYFLVSGRQTTNLASINKTSLGQLPVALPPRQEQRAIADALGDLDTLLDGLDRLIAKKRNIKQAAMQQLLVETTRLTGVHTDMNGWITRTLGDIGTWISGGTPSMANASYWGGTMPWITAKDMKTIRLKSSQMQVTKQAIGSGTRTVQTGALLIVVRGMILAHTLPVAVAETTLAFNQDIKALQLHSDVESTFVLYWMLANSQDLLALATESTHGTKRIPMDDLFATRIAIPPVVKQTAIATVLSDMDTEIEALERRREKTRALKQGMMQELLTGRTRLVPTPSAETPV